MADQLIDFDELISPREPASGPALSAPQGDRRLAKTLADLDAGLPPEWILNWQGTPIGATPLEGAVQPMARNVAGNNSPNMAGYLDLEDLVGRQPTRAQAGQIGGEGGRPVPVEEPPKQGNFLEELGKGVAGFDVEKGFMGRASRGLGQQLRDWWNSGKTLEQLQKEGAKFRPMPSPEASPPLDEAVAQLAKAAKENPGRTLGEFIAASGEDAWMFLLPEFGAGAKMAQVAARVHKRLGTPARIAGKGAELGAVGAVAETAAQALEPRTEMDWQGVANSSAMWAGLGVAMGSAGAAVRGFGSWLARRAPASEGAQAATVDSILKEYEGSGGNAAEVRKQASVADLNKMVQASLNAEKVARDLVDRNASLKSVEKAVKSNRLVGVKINEILQERKAFRSGEMARGVRQGEVLPPDQLAGPRGEAPPPGPPQLPGSKGAVDRDLLIAMGLGGAAGTGLAAWWGGLDEETKADLRPRFNTAAALAGAVLAVKGKGGAWHPGTAKKLSVGLSPYETSRTPERVDAYKRVLNEPSSTEYERLAAQDLLESHHRGQQFDRMAVNYLNKHAGTATDPARDVRLPSGKTWEEVMDQAIYEEAGIHDYVWSQEQSDWLAHVADYARNIPTEKLPNYDIPRLFREVAEADAKAARAALKEATKRNEQKIEQQQYLPVYREYKGESLPAREFKITKPDSRTTLESVKLPAETTDLKWVEFPLPEKLTPEQTKAVRPFEEMRDRLPEQLFVAQDSQGRPLVDKFNGEFATGRTPEEAWHHGQLVEEGNSQGICVGGYCGKVTQEGSRIFSLRDAKGRSLVTVEVEPNTKAGPAYFYNHYDSPEYKARYPVSTSLHDSAWLKSIINSPEYRKWAAEQPIESVSQIKGPGNGSIEPAYRKYVADFLNSRPWGTVKDLALTGLIRDRTGKFVPGESVLNRQSGKADIGLLGTIAAAGTGAVVAELLDENPLVGATLAGLLALLARGKGLKAFSNTQLARHIEDTLGVISTGVKHISEPVWHRMVKFEFLSFVNTHKALAAVDPFVERLNRLPGELKDRLNLALLNNSIPEVERIIREAGDPELARGWTETRRVLDAFGAALKGSNRLAKLRPDYFPRVVKDVEGLVGALELSRSKELQGLLNQADATAVRSRGTGLSPLEASVIINRFLAQRQGPSISEPGFTKSRRVDVVTKELAEFYAMPTESLHTYLKQAVTELEKNRLFGKDLKLIEKGDHRYVNMDDSLGSLVEREVREGRVQEADKHRLRELLRSRFVGGEQAPSKFVQAARNLTYLGLLGDVSSGMFQSADAIMSIAVSDLRSTLEAIARQVGRKPLVKMSDFGLADHIAEEFVSTVRSAKWLKTVLKPIFSKVDAVGKTTVLNAAVIKGFREAQSAKGVEKLAQRYATAWGDEWPQLLADLRARQITPAVKLMAFHELSNIQPVSRLEMPKAYLDNPNGRLLYTLHTYQIKQFDVARRVGYDKIKAGKVREGFADLAKLAVVLGVAGATGSMMRDFILGKELDAPSWTTIWDNVFKTYGWSEYASETLQRRGPVEAAGSLMAPPWRVIDEVYRDPETAMKLVPWVGKTFYYNFMGGAEKAAEAKTKREARNSPEAEERRERAKLRKEMQP